MKKFGAVLSMALLWCSTALAMLPVEGVYEKVDANGQVVGRLQTWDASGSVGREGQNWANSEGAPYICLQGYENGEEFIQIGTSYIWKNDANGAGETAVVLKQPECYAGGSGMEIVGERRENVAAFSWKNEDNVYVGVQNADHSFNAQLSGNYQRVAKNRVVTPAIIMYAYEHNQEPKNFYIGAAKPQLSYTMGAYVGKLPLQNCQINNKSMGWEMNIFVEDDFNLVIEADGQQGNDYYFPFVHRDFLARTARTWGNNTECGTITEEAAAWALRKLYAEDSYAGLRPGSSGCLTFQDFFSGEGENAVATTVFAPRQSLVEKGWLQKGVVSVAENGGVQVSNYTGTATVKGTEIRFRDGANSASNVIGEMNNGERVQCLGLVHGADRSWAYIKRADGSLGFMAAQYLVGLDF